MLNTNKQVMRMAIDKYGHKHQTIVAIEEMAELTKELTKYLRGNGNKKNLIEEISDVEICLEELKEMYNVKPAEVWEEMAFKLRRLEDRMRRDFDE